MLYTISESNQVETKILKTLYIYIYHFIIIF